MRVAGGRMHALPGGDWSSSALSPSVAATSSTHHVQGQTRAGARADQDCRRTRTRTPHINAGHRQTQTQTTGARGAGVVRTRYGTAAEECQGWLPQIRRRLEGKLRGPCRAGLARSPGNLKGPDAQIASGCSHACSQACAHACPAARPARRPGLCNRGLRPLPSLKGPPAQPLPDGARPRPMPPAPSPPHTVAHRRLSSPHPRHSNSPAQLCKSQLPHGDRPRSSCGRASFSLSCLERALAADALLIRICARTMYRRELALVAREHTLGRSPLPVRTPEALIWTSI